MKGKIKKNITVKTVSKMRNFADGSSDIRIDSKNTMLWESNIAEIRREFEGSTSFDPTLSGDEYDVIEYGTDGVYTENEKYIEISYYENDELGLEHVKSSIRFSKSNPRKADLIRIGSNPTSLIFDLDVPRRICSYALDEMAFEICVCTNDVRISHNDHGGKIYLDYFIEIHGSRAVHNIYTLEYKF